MLALKSAITRGVAPSITRTSNKVVANAVRSARRNVSKKPIVPEYSPHVSIYKFPFAAIVSVSNRFAGVGLAAGFWAVGAASLFCPTAVPALWACVKSYPFLLALTKGAVAFPLSFHYLAGIRHMIWDNSNWGIESVEAVNLSSKVLVGATAAVTVGAMIL